MTMDQNSLRFYAEPHMIRVQRWCIPVDEDEPRLQEWGFPIPVTGQLPIEVRTDSAGLIVWAVRPVGFTRALLTVGPWSNRLEMPDWKRTFGSSIRSDVDLIIDAPWDARIASMSEPGYRREPMVPTALSRLIDVLVMLQKEHLEESADALTTEELEKIGSSLGFNLAYNYAPSHRSRLHKLLGIEA